MEYWEFLLQKKDDPAWNFIKNSDMEIEEGKYRIVAHSHLINTKVEIRVIHQFEKDNQLQRRSFKRFRSINEEGLIVIIPFTDLAPGLWKFNCCGDLMNDLLGNSWQKTIQLNVISKSSQSSIFPVLSNKKSTENEGELVRDNLELDATIKDNKVLIDREIIETLIDDILDEVSQEIEAKKENVNETINIDNAETNLTKHEVLAETLIDEIVEVKAETQSINSVNNEIIDQQLKNKPQQSGASLMLKQSIEDLQRLLEEDPPMENTLTDSFSEQLSTNNLKFNIILEQNTFVVNEEKEIVIKGKIEPIEDNLINLNNSLIQCILNCELKEPETGKVKQHFEQNLTDNKFPLFFNYQINLPQNWNSYLIVGQIIADIRIENQTALKNVVQEIFTITLGVNRLLDLVKKQEEIEEDQESSLIDDFTEKSELTENIKLNLSDMTLKNVDNLDFVSQENEELDFGETHYIDLFDATKINQKASFSPLKKSNPFHTINKNSNEDNLQKNKSPELPSFMTKTVNSHQKFNISKNSQPEVILSENETIKDEINLDFSYQTSLNLSEEELIISENQAEEKSSKNTEFSIEKAEERFFKKLNSFANDQQIFFNSEDDLKQGIKLTDETRKIETINRINLLEKLELDQQDWERAIAELMIEIKGEKSEKIETDQVVFPELINRDNFLLEETAIIEDDNLILTEDINNNLQQQLKAESAMNQSLEIVIDDEIEEKITPFSPPVKKDSSGLPYPQEILNQNQTESVIIPDEVPSPIVVINQEELIAGEGMIIDVKIPPYQGSIYVKLWIQDRQTRTLLSGPIALVDFTPNRKGELEIMTQIKIPFGAMEITISAVTINADSQRESHKIMLNRIVLPSKINETELDFDFNDLDSE